MEVLRSKLNINSDASFKNHKKMTELIFELEKSLTEASSEGQEKYILKHKKRHKLLARERISLLLDRASPFLELMPLAGLNQKGMTPGASLVVGLGKVSGVWCLINANVATQKGGALNESSVSKYQRMDEIAFENKLPVIYLNESAGADLSQQAKIFNVGGASFKDISRRSKAGIPSISVVFGSSTAGGAYVPGMSDYVIMVDKQAKTYLAGPPLVKMALGEEVSDEKLGGARMHATQSGLCDFLAKTESQAISLARQVVESFKHNYNITEAKRFSPPKYNSDELLNIIPDESKTPYDVREVIARITDGSRFFEFKPLYGETLITGFAEIMGRSVGILANNGVLESESANKGAHFIQLCQKQNRPLLFLQNITGFMVGKDAEASGIIRNGAKLINAVSNTTCPCITILIGNSYGAGNYGMCGRAYNPRFLFAWPNSKLAIMGSEQLTGVLEILQMQKTSQQGSKAASSVDKEKIKAMKELLRKQVEDESSAYYGTSRVWDDAIIDPRDTRSVLGICLDVFSQISQAKAGEWGSFRM